MAKHSAPQTVAVVPTGATIIRPVAVSAEAYLGKLRAMAGAAVAPVAPGRHAR
ncbi:hypothetical protein ACFPK1_27120 [Actinomycetospora rhizophila]|uniref:Uncharacterized protein n=1 Tax=Actinomycetospora rhizophila TaxID=1416876 RepID=A0ABV9ZKU3_9PSEU